MDLNLKQFVILFLWIPLSFSHSSFDKNSNGSEVLQHVSHKVIRNFPQTPISNESAIQISQVKMDSDNKTMPQPAISIEPATQMSQFKVKSDNRTMPQTSVREDERTYEVAQNNEPEEDVEIIEKDNKCGIVKDNLLTEITIRKCCKENEFYSTLSNECVTSTDNETFVSVVHSFSVPPGVNVSIFSKKVDECIDIRTAELHENSFYSIVGDGQVYDCYLEKVYNQTEYCMEMVGSQMEDATLVLIYCPKNINVIPKCCPVGHFYDTRTVDCTPYFYTDDEQGDSLLAPFLNENAELGFSDLTCQDQHVEVNMNEVYLNGSDLCISKNDQCYLWDKYCIDNVLNEETHELVQAAFVCPIYFINKCCPEGYSFDDYGCTKVSQQSPYLADILKKFTYHVKTISRQGKDCTPVTIMNINTSDISWTIQTDGTALISKKNYNITTGRFCVEDYFYGQETTPVLKVCSEDVKEYAEVSSLNDYSENVLGKCCPLNMVYFAATENSFPSCMEVQSNITELSEIDEIKSYNISQLLYTSFPKCPDSDGYYHAYALQSESFSDYAELTAQNNLKVAHVVNNCKLKETEINASMFCIDYKVKNGQYKPYAFVCAISRQDPHYEKTGVVVSLVGLSSGALFASLILLLSMRVRRGMVTVRKVKTLAGKILTSYVFSQLVGYLILGVMALADFGVEESQMNCTILTGFLLFFTMAAFCWNTSICLEGLLLTMNVRISDRRRYLLHSLWAWGFPGIVTTLTLIRNSKGDELPCDAIKPRIGEDRCFFSDAGASLLFFYLPISITVILNGVLLMAGKTLRQSRLKKLEKDPNAATTQGTIKKALSVKNFKSRIRREPTFSDPKSTHSGLRTHQNKNVWIESTKIVLWSGTTWLMDIIGTLVAMYYRPQGEWYSYLWYIPVGCNCLRGLGIFIIIALTSESQSRFLRTVRSVSSGFGTTLSKFMTDTVRFNRPNYSKRKDPNSSVDKRNIANGSQFKKNRNVSFTVTGDNHCDEEGRRISVSTIFTNVSGSTTNPVESPDSRLIKYYHSVSRSDPVSYGTSLPHVIESFEFSEVDSDQTKFDFPETNSLENFSMESAFWDNVPSLFTKPAKLSDGWNWVKKSSVANKPDQVQSFSRENEGREKYLDGAEIEDQKEDDDLSSLEYESTYL